MDKIKIWTDGSCSNNQSDDNFGGWGVVIRKGNHLEELFGGAVNTTNNKMELQATIEGLKALESKDIPVEIYLDSAYVLNGITSWIHGWKQKGWKTASKKPVENKELWVELDNLRNTFSQVSFIKVKGHSGEPDNELADKLANKGTSLAREGGDLQKTSTSNFDVKEVVQEKTKTITLFDKLKLQIDNLELMYKEHQSGNDVSTMVYWQVETINEILNSFENHVGADEVRGHFLDTLK